MEVTVRVMSPVSNNKAGNAQTLNLDEGTTVGTLLGILNKSSKFSSITSGPSIVFVNRSSATSETRLSDGDEVLIVQPIAGG